MTDHDDDDEQLMRSLADALGHDPDRSPPADGVAAVRAAAGRRRAGEVAAPRPGPKMGPARRPARRFLLTGGIAAGVGGIAGYLLRDVTDSPGQTVDVDPQVPVEPISFTGPASASVVSAGLINHTWGVELLLDVEGLVAGRAYEVVYETAGGPRSAGSLLAVDGVVMRCRFNASAVRDEVSRIDLVDPDGEPVLRARLA